MNGWKDLRIAIVHDALCVPGGAERFLLGLASAFPHAPIFTSCYLPDQTFPEFKKLDVRPFSGTSWVKNERQFKLFFPYWLYRFQRLDLSEYDVVISSSTYLAKYINPKPPTVHVCYLHAPFRLLWSPESYSNDSLPVPKILTGLTRVIAKGMRGWDIKRTNRIDQIYANSKNMAGEIKKIYGREAGVIYPPLDLDRFAISATRHEYFITLSRLISHKRIDIAIEACSLAGKELWVIGDGPERSRLEKMAGPSIKFLGSLTDDNLVTLLKEASALLFPGLEDFGLAPIEAMACGVPVIAYGKGGVLETVTPGLSGVFFGEQTPESLNAAIEQFGTLTFAPATIRESVLQFEQKNFAAAIQKAVQLAFEQGSK